MRQAEVHQKLIYTSVKNIVRVGIGKKGEKQRVTHLDVAVDNVVLVQVVERGDDLGAVEARPVLAERLDALQVEEELAAARELHHEAQPVLGLERVLEELCAETGLQARR